jgi:hypothetical protein
MPDEAVPKIVCMARKPRARHTVDLAPLTTMFGPCQAALLPASASNGEKLKVRTAE